VTVTFPKGFAMKKKVCCFLSILPVLVIAAFFSACDIIPEPTKTPVAGDFTIGNLAQTAGSVTAVTITPKSGKSTGAITIHYDDSTTIPQTVGTYEVTFDVAEASGWNAVTGLSAGNLVVSTGDNKTPVASDYDIAKMGQTAGSVVPVTITPKADKSPGAVSIKYGTAATPPQEAGTYLVTFDVAVAAGWNSATGLTAGILVVYAANPTNQTPDASDYDIAKLGQTAGSVVAVTITAKDGKSTGRVSNVRYNSVTTIPQTAGTYPVTFDVDAVTGWNVATGLSAGNLTVKATGDTTETPVAGDYEFGKMTQTVGQVVAVTITPKTGKSPGVVSNIRYNESTTLPTTVGTYPVTFDVAAATGWNAVTGLSAGKLVVASTGTPGLHFEPITNPNGNGTIVGYRVSKGTVDRGAVEIPATYNGLPVTEINGPLGSNNGGAFSGIAIISVSIPSSVRIIGDNAFYRCSNLQSITIPAGVTEIGQSAFYYCSGLASVTIPASVTSIGNNAFYGCSNLTSITVDSANTAYASDSGILYNKAKTKIEQVPGAISGNIIIPSGVMSIGYMAFNGCTGLTGITIPISVTSIDMGAFTGCINLASVTIPANVTSIGWMAFAGCTKLTTVNIPASVTEIGDGIFAACVNLTTITVAADNPNYISDDNILYDKNKTRLIQVPAKKSGTANIPATVTEIGYYAFYGCTSLTHIALPGITKIWSSDGFEGCTGLTNIAIPSVTEIGELAFAECSSLVSVVLGQDVELGIESIGPSAPGSPPSPPTITYGEPSFPGNLDTVYNEGGKQAGIYSRTSVNSAWTGPSS